MQSNLIAADICSAPMNVQAPYCPTVTTEPYLQQRPGAAADRVQCIVVSNHRQAGVSVRLDHRTVEAMPIDAIAIQILLEARLQRSQRIAGTRHNAPGAVGNDVAVSIGVPDRVLIRAGQMQSNLVPARYLFRSDERPGAVLTDRDH